MKRDNFTVKMVKSVRKTWDFDPVTRVVKSRKAYVRKEKYKQNWAE